MKTAALLFVFGYLVHAASVRDIDFKNFSYPFVEHRFVSVPSRLQWLPVAQSGRVELVDGRRDIPCDDDPKCRLLTFDDVVFGDIHGLGHVALATTIFHTGGTANWEYLYVVGIRAGQPKVLAWLEAGSRADMGLRSASATGGDLVLVVNDPNKRIGDCCSTGTITLRYRWQNGAFRQVGQPVKTGDPPQ